MLDPLFTADSHLMHRNIIKYTGRPFTTTEEHDEQLIINWNECVPEKGDIYHIGDIAFGSTSDVRKLLARLNGTIYLIRGNHDRNVLKLDRFAWVKDYYAATAPHSEEGAYVNFAASDDQDRVRANYGSNYERLVEVKRRYDPDNLFRHNQNIRPE